MEERFNTAEHDAKGRCVRHPTIRLRKKKLFGGWKIIIGHCPECCLDEMRRVRDEIERQEMERNRRDDDDDDYEDGYDDEMDEEERERRRIKKEKKKQKKADRQKERERRHRSKSRSRTTATLDSSGSVLSGGTGGESSSPRPPPPPPPRPPPPPQQQPPPGYHVRQPYPPQQQHPVHYQQQQHYPAQQYRQPPPPPVPNRTMVLSMSFTDPRTGLRGTYTGQVNSSSHKPDGKGTVYYANGSIAEGTWMDGILVESENGGDMDYDDDDGGDMVSELERMMGPPVTGRGGGAGGSKRSVSQPPRMHHSMHNYDNEDGISNSFTDRNLDSLSHSFNDSSLDNKLDRLSRRKKSNRPSGSASVQSYNSRGSVGLPSGSASVQLDYGVERGGMVNLSAGGSQGLGFVGGGNGGPSGGEFQRRNSGYKPRQPHDRQGGSPSGGSPPGFR